MNQPKSDDPWSGIGVSADRLVGVRIDRSHPLDIYWVRSPDGSPGILFRGVDALRIPYSLPKPRGISIEVGEGGGVSEVRMYLRQPGGVDVFRTLCLDVIGFSIGQPTRTAATESVFRRLEHWHALMSRARTTEMSPREVRGLLGELHVLEVLIAKRGIESALGSWIAPDDHPQDFSVDSGLIEVKARLAGTRPRVRISSLEQLETSTLPLSLVVIQLVQSIEPDAFSLNALCDRILATARATSIASEDAVQIALLKRGYTKLDAYGNDTYLVTGAEAFHVGPGFPRIRRREVDARIPEAKYTLDLSQLDGFEVDFAGLF